MKTYFSRHSSDLDIDRNTFDQLWKDDYIAIHYPHDKHDSFKSGDATSLNPGDYEKTAKSSLRALVELAKNGGYVFAVYNHHHGGKIGFVSPNSKIELLNGKWGSRNGLEGRDAVLKAIKLETPKNLTADECISLKSVQPRQGTFVRWHKVGSRVKSLLNGKTERNVGSLTPDLQEVMCMEFLRTDLTKKYLLPKLAYTLSPVGRTMKDVDIIGSTEDKKLIYSQVTFHKLESGKWKLNKLDNYSGSNNHTVFFCKCDNPSKINNHHIFPIDLVFEEFCINSSQGQNWFQQVT